jgi:CheY-like chemotaxis protein
LVISRRWRSWGGRVWAESSGIAEEGSTFLLLLPAPQLESEVVTPRAPRIDLEGRTILVVEGNETVRRRLADQLRRWGASVEAVASVVEAILPRDGARLDAVVIAEVLPDASGLEAAAVLRDRLSAHPPAIVIASAFGRRETVARLAEARGLVVAGHLSKPVKAAGLAGVMSSALGVEAPRVASAPSATRPDAGMAAANPLRILVAEDNPVNQKLALRLLEQRGYRADVAGNGLEVLESIERQPYDLVLMDVQMPEMDGLEATRRIVERWRPAERPRIVAMTANASTEDREACLTAGMDGYISKPIRPQELTDQLAVTRARA